MNAQALHDGVRSPNLEAMADPGQRLLRDNEMRGVSVAVGSQGAPRLAAPQQTSGLTSADCAGRRTSSERTGASHYPINRPHSTARRAASRRFGTPSFMFMRWKRELIELLLTFSSAAMRLLLWP